MDIIESNRALINKHQHDLNTELNYSQTRAHNKSSLIMDQLYNSDQPLTNRFPQLVR